MTFYDYLTGMSLDEMAAFMVQPGIGRNRKRFGSINGNTYATREEAEDANRVVLNQSVSTDKEILEQQKNFRPDFSDQDLTTMYGVVVFVPLPMMQQPEDAVITVTNQGGAMAIGIAAIQVKGEDAMLLLFRNQNEAKVARNILRMTGYHTGQILVTEQNGDEELDVKEVLS